MSKEMVNYKTTGSVIVKRSPVLETRGKQSSAQLHNAISQNIHSLNRVLRESKKIMPIINSSKKY